MDDDDAPPLFHRHLILCRTIWYTGELDDWFSLGRLIVQMRPGDGRFPFLCDTRFFLFAQLYGRPEEYTVRIRLTRVTADDDTQDVHEDG